MKPGPASKSPEKRQRRNKQTASLRVVDGNPVLAAHPPAERRWLKKTKEAYAAFWEADVAAAVSSGDFGALIRMFDLMDDHERMMRLARRAPIVEGSQGQPRAHPAWKEAATLRGEIRQLEDRFGLNPSARAKLGVEVAAAERSLLDMIGWDDPADDPDDPRVTSDAR